MGSISVGASSDIKAAVLNVPGVGWADILENTQTLQISCQLVDGLIVRELLEAPVGIPAQQHDCGDLHGHEGQSQLPQQCSGLANDHSSGTVARSLSRYPTPRTVWIMLPASPNLRRSAVTCGSYGSGHPRSSETP